VSVATLLRISEAAALAFHAMGTLAAGPQDAVVSSRALSRACHASDAHMVKVCQRLNRRGLLQARRGQAGGFRLARSASRIRLFDIYVAIEGPVKLRPCLFRDHDCCGSKGHGCVYGREIRRFEEQFLQFLKKTSLASVARRCHSKAAA
jgi:Rrf2 family protein